MFKLRTNQCPLVLILVPVLLFIQTAYAQPDSGSNILAFELSKFKWESGVEYLWPVERERQIQTVSFNAFIGKEFFRKIHLSPYGGITATYAWGNIIQMNDTFQEMEYDNAAFGIGPVFMMRFELLVYRGFTLGADASGAVVFYSSDFPAGGDFYNFMWRIGPTAAWRFNSKYSINAGYRWMHVSNGQGIGQHNPYYPAQGISINFDRYF